MKKNNRRNLRRKLIEKLNSLEEHKLSKEYELLFDELTDIHNKVETQSKFSNEIDNFEFKLQETLKDNIELLLEFINYKYILYQHFLEVERIWKED